MQNQEDFMEVVQGQKILRRGYTTGTTATAAAKYALMHLAQNAGDGDFPKEHKKITVQREAEGEVLEESYVAEILRIKTPSGIVAEAEIKGSLARTEEGAFDAEATAVKDSGDDPDVTHRAEISAHLFMEEPRFQMGETRDYLYQVDLKSFEVFEINTYEDEAAYRKDLARYLQTGLGGEPQAAVSAGGGEQFFLALRNGQGVGRVGKKGLAPSVDHAAINPGPRKMILEHLLEVAGQSPQLQKTLINKVLVVEIRVRDGEILAQRTFNPKLGIEGGISIIGTSGIVEPMSEKALVDTIKTELRQFIEEGQGPLLICPGNYGQDFIAETLGIDIDKSIKVSNYIGEALDYSVYLGIKEALFVGHAGKLLKLAASIMNTHSSYADGRAEILASHGAISGASVDSLKKIMGAISIDEMLEALLENGHEVFKKTMASIQAAMRRNLDHRTRENLKVEFVVFTQEYGIIIESEGAQALAQRIQEEK